MPSNSKISLVVPVYNEAESVQAFYNAATKHIGDDYEIVFINDGSTDNTADKVADLCKKDKKVKLINFSRNFGKEAALTAGLQNIQGDCVIPIDVDLQDPPSLIPDMLKKWQAGAKVVLAKRKSRQEDGFFKRVSAKIFYKLIGRLSENEIPQNTGDFRLMDAQVVESINQLKERTRFMKGILSWTGYKPEVIEYERPSREAGKTSWSFRGLWRLALDGIFSFSAVPLKIWTYIGALISIIAFIYGSILILRTLVWGVDVPGYPSIMVTVLFLGGIQLISLGVIGEYIARIYNETKQRPLFVIESTQGF